MDSEGAASQLKEWNNYKNPQSGMDRYGDQRMKLAILLRDNILNELGFPWIVENGTLLGAWRNGKFIPHDDDFDIAMFFENDAKSRLPDVMRKIKHLLPPQYDIRMIDTYTDKLEVFDASYGSYMYNPSYKCPDPHAPTYPTMVYYHVTVDIQPYQRIGNVYRSLYKNHPRLIELNCDDVLPLGSITLEGEIFQAPGKVESVLKTVYGSLSTKAKYNKELGLYVDEEVN